ncbi:DUF262 domain-containing protein [Alienimonas californiensis]|uniref:DUF262 domain-containing protein n=1 Tax=Alienimonas californiensis TaxID=2527989 RepID=A0A517P5G1_9PLAN|nr:DUF262 domain-containing protein [Alienimonas californiensis]QDT14609.1 hypothetical protein CA12_06850 [Alienimonas californiensis]
MPEQTIHSADIGVAGVFQSFYVVPDYQREYVWQTEQVEQLLGDIYEEQSDAPAGQAPEYFIGSVVVCPGAEDGVLDLIDGQQRMTTLFLTLCAIRDRLKELDAPAPGSLGPQIAATATDETGQDTFRYRLDLQYADSGDVLIRIAESGDATVDAKRGTRSMENIANAYQTVRSFLRREFDEAHEVKAFYGYLTNKVKLIRIETEDVAKALKIFETINDRGVGLDSMDLLKNLLFMKSDRDSFEALKDRWKRLQDTIHRAGEKPLRFLRYFVFSRYEVDKLREDQIYGWFSKNAALCGFDDAPIGFADELLTAAEAYGRFLEGRNAAGVERPSLESLNTLAGSASRQHMILLLAGRELPEGLFDRLVREVESLIFAYAITREHTRTFERRFAQWTKKLRAVRTGAELDAFLAGTVEPDRQALAARFRDAMGRMTYGSLQKYRLKYLLAKLTQDVEVRAYGETEGTKWLKKYMGKEYEIEHIFPTGAAEAKEEFGPISDPAVGQRLGNLTLIEKSINASISNKPFSKKRNAYKQSQLLLTRSIAERPNVGVNTKIDQAVADLKAYEEWNEQTIEHRQRVLTRLAQEVWGVGTADRRDSGAVAGQEAG